MMDYMNKNSEEYVKLNIETYDRLKNDSEVLNKIEDNIKIINYDKNGKLLSGLWFATTDYEESKLEVDLEKILNVLGYDIENYDGIIVKINQNKL